MTKHAQSIETLEPSELAKVLHAGLAPADPRQAPSG